MKKPSWKRLLICIASMAAFSFGNFLGVKAGAAGTNAWSSLSLGLASLLGTTFGTMNLAVGMVILGVDLLGKGKLGVGTVLNILLISWFSDLFLQLLHFFPEAPNQVIGVVYTLSAQMICAFSTVIYMTPGLGCGPRDTLMVILGKKFPKAPIGVVKFGIEIAALVVGVALGAPFGVGTVLIVALQSGMFQFACKVLRCEPRAIVHEDILETLKNMLRRA